MKRLRKDDSINADLSFASSWGFFNAFSLGSHSNFLLISFNLLLKELNCITPCSC